MTNTKKNLAIVAAIAMVGIGVAGTSTVLAAQRGQGKGGDFSALVNAIAEKFHLVPSDVQVVVDAQRLKMGEQMKRQGQVRFAASITQAVKDGKLTQAQADAITAKHKELQTLQTSLEGKTMAERQSAMKTHTDALKQWAKDNNIPEQYVMPFGRGMMRGGQMMHGGCDGRPGTPPVEKGT